MEQRKPEIAILCWEEGQVPRGLVQLESLVGNSTNPASYSFPVCFRRIKGANIETVLENPSAQVLATMIDESKKLVAEGIKAISTSCGFNAVFQQELAEALDVPVFTSSLLLIPLVRRTLPKSKAIGVITAKKAALRKMHFEAAGITDLENIFVFGMEKCPEWNKIFIAPNSDVDLEKISDEVLRTAISAKKEHPEIASFILECTDLPPFAGLIRETLRTPVYDFISMLNFMADAVGVSTFTRRDTGRNTPDAAKRGSCNV